MKNPQIDETKTHRVTYRNGEADLVHIKRLSIRQLYQWSEYLGASNTPAMVAMCTGKPIEFCDALSDESFADLAETCMTENFQRAMIVMNRDPIMAGNLLPVLGRLQKAAAAAESPADSTGTKSPDKSPAPAPSESAAESGSESSTSPSTD